MRTTSFRNWTGIKAKLFTGLKLLFLVTEYCFPTVSTGVVCGTGQLSTAHAVGVMWEAHVLLHLEDVQFFAYVSVVRVGRLPGVKTWEKLPLWSSHVPWYVELDWYVELSKVRGAQVRTWFPLSESFLNIWFAKKRLVNNHECISQPSSYSQSVTSWLILVKHVR